MKIYSPWYEDGGVEADKIPTIVSPFNRFRDLYLDFRYFPKESKDILKIRKEDVETIKIELEI